MPDKRILSDEHLIRFREFCHETEGGIVSDLLDHIAAITEERERLRAALENVKKHMEVSMRGDRSLSRTWCIANRALRGEQ